MTDEAETHLIIQKFSDLLEIKDGIKNTIFCLEFKDPKLESEYLKYTVAHHTKTRIIIMSIYIIFLYCRAFLSSRGRVNPFYFSIDLMLALSYTLFVFLLFVFVKNFKKKLYFSQILSLYLFAINVYSLIVSQTFTNEEKYEAMQIRELNVIFFITCFDIFFSYKVNSKYFIFILCVLIGTLSYLVVIKKDIDPIKERIEDIIIATFSTSACQILKKYYSILQRENFLQNYKLNKLFSYCNDLINNMNGLQFTFKSNNILIFNQKFYEILSQSKIYKNKTDDFERNSTPKNIEKTKCAIDKSLLNKNEDDLIIDFQHHNNNVNNGFDPVNFYVSEDVTKKNCFPDASVVEKLNKKINIEPIKYEHLENQKNFELNNYITNNQIKHKTNKRKRYEESELINSKDNNQTNKHSFEKNIEEVTCLYLTSFKMTSFNSIFDYFNCENLYLTIQKIMDHPYDQFIEFIRLKSNFFNRVNFNNKERDLKSFSNRDINKDKAEIKSENSFMYLGDFYSEDERKYFQIYFRKHREYKDIIDFIFYDITKIKEAEEIEINLKSKFLAKIAHEFKTPLNSIIGLIKKLNITNDMNSETDLSFTSFSLNHNNHILKNFRNKKFQIPENKFKKNFEYLKQIENISHYVIFLINDIIEYSNNNNPKKFNFHPKEAQELSNINLKIEEINLFQICNFVCDIAQTLIINKEKEKYVKIFNSFDAQLNNYLIYSDDFRVKQILLNFISNSIKFTKYGSIQIKSEVIKKQNLKNIENENENNNTLSEESEEIRISVIDTGIGIKEDELQLLLNFQDNNMLSSGIKYNKEGSGLGLSISKKIADILHHRLEISSIYGKGSCFSIIVKAQKAEKNAYNCYTNGNYNSNYSNNTNDTGNHLITPNEKKLENEFSKSLEDKEISNSQSFQSRQNIGIKNNNEGRTSYKFKIKGSIETQANNVNNIVKDSNFLSIDNNIHSLNTDSNNLSARLKNNHRNLNDGVFHTSNTIHSLAKVTQIISRNPITNKESSLKDGHLKKSNFYWLNMKENEDIASFNKTTIIDEKENQIYLNSEIKRNAINMLNSNNIKNEQSKTFRNATDMSSLSANSSGFVNNPSITFNFFNNSVGFKSERRDLDDNYDSNSNNRFNNKTYARNFYNNYNKSRIKKCSNKKISKGEIIKFSENSFYNEMVSNRMNFSSEKKLKIVNNHIKMYIILIADDHKYVRESLSNLIKKILRIKKIENYFRIKEAKDGVDILHDVVKDQFQNNRIKCILTDENMEFLNGSETVKILRNLEKDKKIKPICIASVTNYENPKQLIGSVGFNRFLSKPCCESDLLNFFEEFDIFNFKD